MKTINIVGGKKIMKTISTMLFVISVFSLNLNADSKDAQDEDKNVSKAIKVILKTEKKEYKINDKIIVTAYIKNVGKENLEINKFFSNIKDPWISVNDGFMRGSVSSYHVAVAEEKPNKTILLPGKEIKLEDIDFWSIALKLHDKKTDLKGSIKFSCTPVIYYYEKDKATHCFSDCIEAKFKIK